MNLRHSFSAYDNSMLMGDCDDLRATITPQAKTSALITTSSVRQVKTALLQWRKFSLMKMVHIPFEGDYSYSMTLYDVYGNCYYTRNVTFSYDENGDLYFDPDELA
ncbi:MAG: hypothetical protein ACI4JY_05410 [Oscillospiraceae bacterium]